MYTVKKWTLTCTCISMPVPCFGCGLALTKKLCCRPYNNLNDVPPTYTDTVLLKTADLVGRWYTLSARSYWVSHRRSLRVASSLCVTFVDVWWSPYWLHTVTLRMHSGGIIVVHFTLTPGDPSSWRTALVITGRPEPTVKISTIFAVDAHNLPCTITTSRQVNPCC